jgi:poly-gamma-glutamate synthesis protein (capsule biosynthesis protein)
MVYSGSSNHPALVELARAGNFRAIAHWLNQALMPYGMRAFVGTARPGCLKVLVELHPALRADEGMAGPWQETLVRFVCHRLWKLNSALIEGVRVAARFADQQTILWEQSVRIAAPARRQRQQQSQQLRSQIQQTARRKDQLKTMRVLLMSGSTVFAFVIGAVLAYVKSPLEQSSAIPSPQLAANAGRSHTVQAALEPVPVIKHNQVADPRDPTVNLLFSGDVTLSDSFEETIGKDFPWAFAEMEEYRQADLAMVNLENPLTTATTPLPDKQFNFKADPEMVQVLKEGGVDLVTLANNHTMDFQTSGLLETMGTLDQAGILHMGAGRNITEARRPEVIDVKGHRFAYLSYFGEDHAATEKAAGTSPIVEARIAEDIKAIRHQVDWIVVNYHWGQENASHPADWQQQLARFTIDQGADLVVGHHPHVLQGAEVYKGRPIAYSLGNFIFGGNSRSDYDTAVLRVAVKDKQMKVEFLPIEVQKYQAKVAMGDRANQILQQIADRSSGFAQPLKSPMILDTSKPPAPEPTPAAPPLTAPEPPTPEAATPPPAAIPSVQPPVPVESPTWESPDPTNSPIAPMPNPAPTSVAPLESAPVAPTEVPTPAPSIESSPDPIAPGQETSPFVAPTVSPEPTTAPTNPTDPTVPLPDPNSAPAIGTPESSPGPIPAIEPLAPAPSTEAAPSSNSFTNSPSNTPFKPTTSPPSPPDSAPSDSSNFLMPTPHLNPSPEAANPTPADPDNPDRANQQAQTEDAPNVALMAANLW